MATTLTSTTPLISKSKFLWGLQCNKLLWHAYHGKHLIPEADASQEAAFEQGREVGALARQLFPDGIEVGSGVIDANETVRLTTTVITKRIPLFEAAFSASGGYCRVDILRPSDDDSWDIIEIKSSTGIKDVHLYDLAFQSFVLTAAGLKVRRCVLAHINSDFIKNSEIDPKKFFILEDVSTQVATLSGRIEDKLNKMSEPIRLQQSPEIQIGKHCGDPYPCPIYDFCWSFLPESNVTTLYRGEAKGFKLLANGITELKDIPDDFNLTENQEIQRRTAITGQPHIDKPAIKAFLSQLQYPVSYLDFETLGTAIPLFDGVRPYQQIPFQFSLHIVRSEGAEPEHHKFLAEGSNDPRSDLMRCLRDALPTEGSIVTFNAQFELTRLKECCEFLPEFRSWARNVKDRVVDLLLPFRGFHYYHPKQDGSASMKAVLPALIGKGYDHLEIQDGMTASLQFVLATFGDVTNDEKLAIRTQLHDYCGLDTMGMVWITHALQRVVTD